MGPSKLTAIMLPSQDVAAACISRTLLHKQAEPGTFCNFTIVINKCSRVYQVAAAAPRQAMVSRSCLAVARQLRCRRCSLITFCAMSQRPICALAATFW